MKHIGFRYKFDTFAGNLRHRVQGQVPSDGHHGRLEGDQAGARGGGPLYCHQRGLASQGFKTRKYR